MLLPSFKSIPVISLLTDQGTTPALSKCWMPLAEYTKHTIDSLVRGDPEVVVGMSAAVLEKY